MDSKSWTSCHGLTMTKSKAQKTGDSKPCTILTVANAMQLPVAGLRGNNVLSWRGSVRLSFKRDGSHIRDQLPQCGCHAVAMPFPCGLAPTQMPYRLPCPDAFQWCQCSTKPILDLLKAAGGTTMLSRKTRYPCNYHAKFLRFPETGIA